MEFKAGDTLEEIVLPSIDGSEFNIASVKGKKVLLTFYRFAKWPICNLRIDNYLLSKLKFVGAPHLPVSDTNLTGYRFFSVLWPNIFLYKTRV